MHRKLLGQSMARSLCLSLVFAAASGFRVPSHRAKAPRRAVVAAVAPAPAWVAGACLGGVLGTPFVVAATKTWYGDGTLNLPSWTPPKGIFAPVWTTLYATIGFAAYKAAAANGLPKLAVAHYVGNLLWAPLFFKLKQFKAALGLNVALVASLVAVLPAFGAVGAKALLLPYLAWLVFATVLNAEIVRLNPKGLVEANVGVDTLYS